jgi:CRP/FNR family transcriptional regulator
VARSAGPTLETTHGTTPVLTMMETIELELERLYPDLAGLTLPAPGGSVAAIQVEPGTVLFSEAARCAGFPLVLEGEVRVFRSSGEGRQLELYRVIPGEVCLASSASLFRHQPMAATAVATRPTRLVLVPPAEFERWLEQPAFRNFVMGMFAERMADLAGLIDAVAFRRLDQRLAAALLGHGRELTVTHQALADELGTVREIVTRLLRRFERDGWIELGRERVRIVDSAALRAFAGSVT